MDFTYKIGGSTDEILTDRLIRKGSSLFVIRHNHFPWPSTRPDMCNI